MDNVAKNAVKYKKHALDKTKSWRYNEHKAANLPKTQHTISLDKSQKSTLGPKKRDKHKSSLKDLLFKCRGLLDCIKF